MQEQRALRELAVCSNQEIQVERDSYEKNDKNKVEEPSWRVDFIDEAENNRNRKNQTVEVCRPALQELISLSTREIDFKECLPGSIHQKTFTISILQQLPSTFDLIFTIICEDQALNDSSELVFGIKQSNQYQYYGDYHIKVKNPKTIEFKIGVKTPMYYQYNVKSMLVIQLEDYAPLVMILKQTAQIPDLSCPKQLSVGSQENRVIKLSMIQNKSKRQCKIPFKLNHNMVLSMSAQILGLEPTNNPLIDIKPKMMTLNGKGQFALILIANTDKQIKEYLSKGKVFTARRILIMTIRQTKFIYHFPLQITYYPTPTSPESVKNKQNID